jgi:hypothetical protein
MKTDRKIAVLLPDAVFILILVSFATQPVSAQDPGRLHEIPYSPTLRPTSGQTTTYFAFPFQKLKEAVPALKGLKYDESQERLPSILAGVAQTIANVLPKLPNLVSREEISGFQVPRDPSAAGGPPNAQPWSREFRYLILCHHNSDGSTTIEESRTDAKGNPADAALLYLCQSTRVPFPLPRAAGQRRAKDLCHSLCPGSWQGDQSSTLPVRREGVSFLLPGSSLGRSIHV